VSSKPLRSSDTLYSRGLPRALHRMQPTPSSPLLLSDESHVMGMWGEDVGGSGGRTKNLRGWHQSRQWS
jgi:hypothetical protein